MGSEGQGAMRKGKQKSINTNNDKAGSRQNKSDSRCAMTRARTGAAGSSTSHRSGTQTVPPGRRKKPLHVAQWAMDGTTDRGTWDLPDNCVRVEVRCVALFGGIAQGRSEDEVLVGRLVASTLRQWRSSVLASRNHTRHTSSSPNGDDGGGDDGDDGVVVDAGCC